MATAKHNALNNNDDEEDPSWFYYYAYLKILNKIKGSE
jgi:hypothetical protein